MATFVRVNWASVKIEVVFDGKVAASLYPESAELLLEELGNAINQVVGKPDKSDDLEPEPAVAPEPAVEPEPVVEPEPED